MMDLQHLFDFVDVSRVVRHGIAGRLTAGLEQLPLNNIKLLSLQHNELNGSLPDLICHIPASIAKLTVLESLDLSSNQLKGEIPHQLTYLYSLAVLNLSCNQLRGKIPQGFQFNTFENDSYVGNLGLCGNPLSKKCGHDNVTQEEDEEEDDDYFFGGFIWEAVVIGYGCGVVPAFIAGYLMLLARKPKWFAGIIAREWISILDSYILRSESFDDFWFKSYPIKMSVKTSPDRTFETMNMKSKPTGVFTPARGIAAVGGVGLEGYAPLEMRPGGMQVQKRNSDADHSLVVVPNIKVKVKHGSSYLEFNISSQASFALYVMKVERSLLRPEKRLQ
ncbi:hypothetical protein AgCh_023458 [Apium graveolens]